MIGCKYCLLPGGKGIRLSDCFETDEEFFDHIESEHHIPVRRDGERNAETMERFRREKPEAGGPNCKCPTCQGHQRTLEVMDSLTRPSVPEAAQ